LRLRLCWRARGRAQDKKLAFKRTDLGLRHAFDRLRQRPRQLAYYELLERQGHLRFLRTAADLKSHWATSVRRAEPTLGFILSMEGTDPIVTPELVHDWWRLGLPRRRPGPLRPRATCLWHCHRRAASAMPASPCSKEFEKVGMILDVHAPVDTSMAQALDLFKLLEHGDARHR